MKDYVEISVQADLLPQVARDLLALAADPNHVHASTGEFGPVLLVHPVLAETWFQTVANEEVEASTEPEAEATEGQPSVDVPVTEGPTRAPQPVEEKVANETIDDSSSAKEVANETNAALEPDVQLPVKRGPGRPRKVTSASLSEVLHG